MGVCVYMFLWRCLLSQTGKIELCEEASGGKKRRPRGTQEASGATASRPGGTRKHKETPRRPPRAQKDGHGAPRVPPGRIWVPTGCPVAVFWCPWVPLGRLLGMPKVLFFAFGGLPERAWDPPGANLARKRPPEAKKRPPGSILGAISAHVSLMF